MPRPTGTTEHVMFILQPTCPLGTARCQLETQKIKQVNQK